MGANSTLYDRDFYAWSHEQAALLRDGRVSEADLGNIAEEIESMGRREKRELVDGMVALLLHLAKWRFPPSLRDRNWQLAITALRLEVADILADNPSLRSTLTDVLVQAWRRARFGAERETGLDASSFPKDCSWTAEQALDDAFWPD
jgi:hypothetical protein